MSDRTILFHFKVANVANYLKPKGTKAHKTSKKRLPQPQPVAHLRHIVRLLAVHLIEVFQTDAVFLRNGVHGIPILHHIDGIGFGRLLLLFLQVDDVPLFQRVIFLQVIVFHQLLPADAKLLAQRLEGVAVTGHNVSDAVGNEHLMRTGKPGLLLHQFLPIAHDALAIILIKVIILNNRNQAVGIRRVGGIACLLQSACNLFASHCISPASSS